MGLISIEHARHAWIPTVMSEDPGRPAKYIFNSCTCPGDPGRERRRQLGSVDPE